MLKHLTRRLLVPAILMGMLSGLIPSMLATRTAHADETSQSESSTALDKTATPTPKQTDMSEPAPLTADDVQVRSAVVPDDALASGTAGTCLFYITSDMRLVLTPSDGQSGTLPTGSKASDWPWYRYAAYVRTVSFDKGVRTSSTLENAFRSSNTASPEYNQLESVDLANLDMADLTNMHAMFANDTKLKTVSFKGVLDANGITTWTSAFYSSGIESVDLTGVGDAAVMIDSMFFNCASLKTAVIPWAMEHVTDSSGMFDSCTNLTYLDTSVWRFGVLTNATRMFHDCKGLTELDVADWDVSHVVTFESTFQNCTNLITLDVADWDTSGLCYTGYMFSKCANLTVLDVSGWSMGKVWFANYMFFKCVQLTVLDVSQWNVHSLQQANCLFFGCSNLATLDVSKWDTTSLVYASGTFQDCAQLTVLDVSQWRMGNVRIITSMFAGCPGLTKLDVADWDVSHVNNMQNTFTSCTGLTTLDISKWDTSSVTNMYAMFQNCKGLIELDVSDWDVSHVKTFDYMFYWCPNLARLDVSKWDTSSVTVMTEMFHYDAKLTVLDVTKWDVSHVTSFSQIFSGCSKLTVLDVAKWDMSNAVSINGMFYGCSGLAVLDVAKWDVSHVADAGSLFSGCSGLARLDVSKWNTPHLRQAGGMFQNCKGLTVLDVADWDMSNVTSTTYMFYGCSKLTVLDVTKWDVHGMLNAAYMFTSCVGLTTLDLSGWNTSSLTSTDSMFRNLTVTRIYIGDGWTMDNVDKSPNMFAGCSRLVGDDGKGLAYDMSKLDATYAHADGGYMTFKGARIVYRKAIFTTPDGKTVSTMRVRDGESATAPDLSDTTWLADPDMNFNTDGWSGTITAKGKRQTGRDDYSTASTRHMDTNSVIRVDADADYRNASAGGVLGYHLKRDLDGQSGWLGYTCSKGTVCTGVTWYSTGNNSGTVRAFTQIGAQLDYGEAYVSHMQLTQVDPVTHNGIARDGYVFTGWNKDVTKPITGDTVFTAQYRPVSYRIHFDGNGATSGTMTDQTLTYGTPRALTAATFQRDGYSLTGWNTRPDGTGKAFADRQTVANLLTHDGASGTLYAQWTYTPAVITVVFHANNGTDETVRRVWASNNLDMKAIGLPDGWTRKGFAFHGWNLAADGSGVEYEPGEGLYGRMTTETVDLYADWAGLQSVMPLTGGHRTTTTAMGAAVIVVALALAVAARRRAATHAFGHER